MTVSLAERINFWRVYGDATWLREVFVYFPTRLVIWYRAKSDKLDKSDTHTDILLVYSVPFFFNLFVAIFELTRSQYRSPTVLFILMVSTAFYGNFASSLFPLSFSFLTSLHLLSLSLSVSRSFFSTSCFFQARVSNASTFLRGASSAKKLWRIFAFPTVPSSTMPPQSFYVHLLISYANF